jgi:hypothetical protein
VKTESIQNGTQINGSATPLERLEKTLGQFSAVAHKAKKHGFRITSHSFYRPKANELMADLRKEAILLRNFSRSKGDAGGALIALADMVDELSLQEPADELVRRLDSIEFHIKSDLAAALEASSDHSNAQAPFMPEDLIPRSVYRKILDEANRCFDARCCNGCAAMLRRIIESLIIEAFESLEIEHKLKGDDGEYLELKALIGKATAEPKLKLSRNTKNALPNLKFLGDLSVHGRRHFVLAGDLERVRNDARTAIQELASYFKP